MSDNEMAMTREEMYAALEQVINDCDSVSDSGCDSQDEFIPVGNVEAVRFNLAGEGNGEDSDCSASVCESESGVFGSSDEWAGRSSPEGSAGSDEADPSDCYHGQAAQELLTDEEMLCSSTDNDEDSDRDDTVYEDESGVVSSSDDSTGRSRPEGNSGIAGSDEVDPSECYHGQAAQKLLTDEEMLCSSTDNDEDSDRDDTVCEDESGVVSSSDEWAGRASPEGSSGSAGPEVHSSDCYLRLSAQELLTDEEMRCSSINSSANGDDSTGEQPEGVPRQSPEEQTPADFQQGMILLLVWDQTTAPHGDQQCNTYTSPVTISWENPGLLLLDVTPVAMDHEDE